MICAKTFNYLHIMKTGGSWMQRAMEQYPNEVFRKAAHMKFSELAVAEGELDRPTYATVRNPWDWHVSMYHFMRDQSRGLPGLGIYQGSFEDVLLAPAGQRRDLSPHIDEMTKREDGREREIIWRRYEDGLPQLLIEMLETRKDVPRLSIEAQQSILNVARVNWSVREPAYAGYYTPELIERVREIERPVIEQYGYRFEVRA